MGEAGWEMSVLSKFFRPTTQHGASRIRRLRSKIVYMSLPSETLGEQLPDFPSVGKPTRNKSVCAMCLARREGLNLAPWVSLAIRGHRGCQSSPLT